MGSQRGQKRQLELARLERAAKKRDRRAAAKDAPEGGDAANGAPAMSESAVLEALADLHRRYADEQISLDDFEVERDSLSSQLNIS